MTQVFEKHQVVMLPCKTAKLGTIMKCIKEMPYNEDTKINTLAINKNWKVTETNGNEYWRPQHLYILSDEEIKEGDWFIHPDSSCFDKECKEVSIGGYEIKQVSKTDEHFVYHEVMAISKSRNIKKIIATTDKSFRLTEIVKEDGNIKFPYITPLPQPSQSFIEHFVEEYNKGNIITEVMVEYDMMYRDMTGEHKALMLVGTEYLKLKVNPKDNTINIKPKKEEWSREEVIVLLQKLADDIDNNYRPYTRDNSIGFDLVNNDGQWIEKNL
jgi:hypothetical protein